METFPLGGMITLIVLMPILLAVIFPPVIRLPNYPQFNDSGLRLMTVVERAGQMGCFIIPFFYHIDIQNSRDVILLFLMIMVITLYYAGWLRYLLGGRAEVLFYRSMLGIPLPMAVMPVVYFLLAAAWLNSIWLLISALILGVGHITVTLRNFQKQAPVHNR
jgi:hypothetical protein